MKNISLRIKALRHVAAALCIAAAAGAAETAYASGNADFYGENGSPVWRYDNVSVYSNGAASMEDLFGLSAKELEPGTQKTVDIRLENHSDEAYTFYLNAAARTGAAAWELESFFPGKAADDSLLDAIDIAVFYKGGDVYSLEGSIYAGKLAGRADANMYTDGGVPLGNLAPRASGNIRVSIYIPGDIGNAYMDTLCAVDWWFTARQEEGPPVTPPTDPPTDVTTPEDSGDIALAPGNIITDNAPPLAELEISTAPEADGIRIDDGSVPLGAGEDLVVVVGPASELPLTGGMEAYAAPAIAVMLLLLCLLAISHKKGREEAKK